MLLLTEPQTWHHDASDRSSRRLGGGGRLRLGGLDCSDTGRVCGGDDLRERDLDQRAARRSVPARAAAAATRRACRGRARRPPAGTRQRQRFRPRQSRYYGSRTGSRSASPPRLCRRQCPIVQQGRRRGPGGVHSCAARFRRGRPPRARPRSRNHEGVRPAAPEVRPCRSPSRASQAHADESCWTPSIRSGQNILFADGSFFYLVAAAYYGPQRLQIREEVIAAASALYTGVSGLPPP